MISRTSWATKRMKLTTCSGLPVNLLAQRRVLGGHADRAGVEVADAHHDTAQGHQRRGGETELLGAEQGGDGHIAAGLQLAVGLDDDPAAQVVQQQGLVRFGQPQFPGQPGMLDAGQRRGAGAAVIAADQHDIGMGLGHPGGNGADADLGHQLDADAGLRLAFFRSWISSARSSME